MEIALSRLLILRRNVDEASLKEGIEEVEREKERERVRGPRVGEEIFHGAGVGEMEISASSCHANSNAAFTKGYARIGLTCPVIAS